MTLNQLQEDKINELTGKFTCSTEFVERIRKAAGYKDDFNGGLQASNDATNIQKLLKLNIENMNTKTEDIPQLLDEIIKGYFENKNKNKQNINESKDYDSNYPPIKISDENGKAFLKQLGRFGDADPNTKHGFYHLININTTLIKQNEQLRQQNNEIIKLLNKLLEKR